MKVVEATAYGGPEVLALAERRRPEPLPTEVLVAVRAAGVNPVDWKTRAGRGVASVLGPAPVVIGWDVAGVVEEVGRGVTRFEPGDEVFGMPWFPRQAGGYGEFITAPSRQLALKPAEIGFVEAAALPLAGLVAWQSLIDTADVEPGQRVLVLGASGGVGHLAVQVACARGALVAGTARPEHHDLLVELGVDEPVDHNDDSFEDDLDEFDVVLDLLGGEYPQRMLELIRPGGILVSPAGLPDGVAEAASRRGVRATGILVEPDGSALDELALLVEEEALRVVVSGTFSLAEAAEAHRAGEAGGHAGKLVIEVVAS